MPRTPRWIGTSPSRTQPTVIITTRLQENWGLTTYFVSMASQQWRSTAEVDRALWEHDMMIAVPWSARCKRVRTAVLFVRGPLYTWFQLEEAAALLSATEIARANFEISIRSGDYRITGDFPKTREALFQFDVVALIDVDAYALRPHRRQMLADDVRARGGLLVCGGPFAFGKGRYAGTELEDVLPVRTKGPWDWKMPAEPTAISPTTRRPPATGIAWQPAPYLQYYHRADARPGTVVRLKAGNDPLLVTAIVSKGRSAALLATPLGKVEDGQTPFWEWHSWPQTMANTLRWLAHRKWAAVRPAKPDPGEINQQLIVAEMSANRLSILNTVPDDENPASSATDGMLSSFQRSGLAQPVDLELNWPCELARDSQGRIYIADYNQNRILRVDDLAGNNLVALGQYSDEQPPGIPGVTPLGFHFPYGIAIDSKGRIYVSDIHNARIVRFDDMTGANWVQLGDRLKWDADRNHFNWPLGLAVDAQDRLYIADSCNNRIVRMRDMSGADWQSINNLDHPISVRVAADDRLYVGMAYRPGLHIFRSITGDGHRILKTETGPRGIVLSNAP